MAKANKPVLPKQWRTFANRYGADQAYWYVPRGLAVTTGGLKPRLKVLKEFEHGKAWRDCQQTFIQRLNDKGISDAEAEWDDGGAPLARMLKQVFVILGLAWVDPNDRVEITPAGDKFLTDKDPDGVLSDQMSRYQFTNPSVASNAHKAVTLHPIPFIGEVLRSIDGQSFTANEYTLFVSRAKTFSDVDAVIEAVEAFRGLDPAVQKLIADTCDAYKLPGIRRSSMYNTIRLDRSYALKMFALSRLVEINDDGGLSIRKGALKDYRGYLSDYGREGAYIEFANEKDWIAYFGDPKASPTIDTALEYYVNKGDVAAAIATKKKTAKTAKELAEFQDMIVSEKAVEDYLENHLDVVGSKIGRKLKLVGRQYSTTVGPIDLLVTDAKSGDYIVIELKKGRSADKVYGQCSRYMGWIRKNLAAGGQKVHGVIVARKIDEKLKAARDAHDTKVDLIEFEMKIGAKAV
jgi:Endonuclease NucS C-terminal domain